MASSPPGSDMSLEDADAAAVQQDLAGSAAAPSREVQLESAEQQAPLQDTSDDPRDAPSMDILADMAAGSLHQPEETPVTTAMDESALPQTSAATTAEVSVPAQESVAPVQEDIAAPQASLQPQENHIPAESAESDQPETIAPSEPAASTNASLDALLGSLAQSHAEETAAGKPTPLTVNAAGNGDSATVVETTQQDGASSLEQQPAEATQDTSDTTMDTQTQIPEAAPTATSTNLDSASASQSTQWSNPPTYAVPDASGPVPGLSIAEPSDTPDESSMQAVSQSQAAPVPQISQIQEQPTPSSTPTLPAATLTSFVDTATSTSTPQPQEIAAQQATTASTSTGGPIKPTPLATDPNLARQTAAQLLQNRPQTFSRLQKLRQRIEKDKFDGDAWLELINDAQQKGDLEKTREVYSNFLSNFPDNVRVFLFTFVQLTDDATRAYLLCFNVVACHMPSHVPRQSLLNFSDFCSLLLLSSVPFLSIPHRLLARP